MMIIEINQSFAKKVVNFLKENSNKTYAFYPSSGRDENENKWKNCPYDYVILCDKEAGKNTIDGKIISIKADNNCALRLIYYAGIKLNCIICKVCGRFEGGNYESNNSIEWLGRILPIMKNEFIYITSATGRMECSKNYTEGPVRIIKGEDKPNWLGDIPNKRSPVLRLIVQRLAKTFHPQYTIDTGRTSITIQRQSIWKDVRNGLDGFFISKRNRKAMDNFLSISAKSKLRYLQDFIIGNSILSALEEAEKMKWETIGMTPWANGNYTHFLNDLKSWKGEYPKVIKLYHLEKKCFSMLYNKASDLIPKNDRCPDCKGRGCDNCNGFGVLMDYDIP